MIFYHFFSGMAGVVVNKQHGEPEQQESRIAVVGFINKIRT